MPKEKKNQLPSGRFRVQACIGTTPEGKRIMKSFTADSRKQARRLADVYIAAHQPTELITDRLESVIQSYISSREYSLSPNTLRGYHSILKYLQTHHSTLLQKRLYDVRTEDIQQLINEMLKAGLTGKSVRNRTELILKAMKAKHVLITGHTFPEKRRPELFVPDQAPDQSQQRYGA